MTEAKTAPVQGDAALALVGCRWTEWRCRAVELIAEHRVAARGGLNANLVSAAGAEFDFKKGEAVEKIENTVLQKRELRAFVARGDNLALCFARNLAEVICPAALGRLNAAFHQRPVDFADAPLLKLSRDALRGALVAGEDDGAAYRPIEPVRYAEVDLSRLALAFHVESANASFQAIDAGRTLRQQTARLVDDEARTVVVEDVEIQSALACPSAIRIAVMPISPNCRGDVCQSRGLNSSRDT